MERARRLPWWGCSVLVLGALVACGGGGDDAANAPAPVDSDPALPAITAVADLTVPVSRPIELTGRQLDQVTAFSLGNQPLAVVASSPTHATLTAPASAGSGRLAFSYTDAGGTARQSVSTFTVAAYVPVEVTRVDPAGGPAGTTVVVTGAALDTVTQVRIGTVTVLPHNQRGDHLELVIPAGAPAAALSLLTPYQTVQALPRLDVVAPVVVTGFEVQVGVDATTLRVRGSGLAQVQSLSVAGLVVTPATRSDTVLTAVVPAPAEGEVTLLAPYQTVRAGRFARLSDAPLQVAGLWVAQQMAQSVDTPGTRLLEGKPTLLKLDLTTSLPDVPAPAVRVSALRSGVVVDSMALSGPATVPQAADAYDLGRGYSATLPGDWLVPGTSFRVDVMPAATGQVSLSRNIAVTIDPVPVVVITLVPMVVRGVAPRLPPLADVREVLQRAFPLRDTARLVVRVRSPYTVTQATGNATDLLSQLDSLRLAEARNEIYHGIVNSGQLLQTGVRGIGYRNALENFAGRSAFTTALSHDDASLEPQDVPFDWAPKAWIGTLVHELGHVFTRPHAPCTPPGGAEPKEPDLNYPYPGGVFGPAALFDAQTGYFGAPVSPSGARMTDVMGYCDGVLFSDYNLAAVNLAMQAYSRFMGAQVKTTASAKPSLPLRVLSGRIEGDRVSLDPMGFGDDEPAEPQAQGTHELRLVGAAGERWVTRFTPVEVADAVPAVMHFRVALPDGVDGTVEIRAGTRLVWSSATTTTAGRQKVQAQAAASPATVVEQGARVTLAWDARLYPSATLAHVGPGGQRLVLGLRLQGGSQVLDLPALPAGGQWQVDLAGPLQALRVQQAR